jgi:alkylation response protein AidB-like acyl-CoA dehydrogenase
VTHPYRLDAQDVEVQELASRLAQDVLAKHATDVDQRARFPEESMTAIRRHGLLGLSVPTAFGGEGRGMRAFAAVAEELAAGCASTAMIYVMHVASAQAIASSGTLKDRELLLKRIAAGDHLTTLAFSERGSRSQFWAPVSQLAAVNGHFETKAEKSWVTSAEHADSYVASGLKPGAAGPLESTVYLVRRTATGVTTTGRFDGLGLRGNDSAPVSFDKLKVDEGDLISPQGEGATTMLQVVLPWFAVGTAAMAHGLCRQAVSLTTTHLSSTGFQHTGSQLRDLPNLRARLAEMSLKTEQSRALLGHALDHILDHSPAAPLFVLQARLSALEAALQVTDLAMKACGGAAFSRHLGLERVFRDARAGWVMAPTADHLYEFTGRALTGLPLFA